MGRLPRCAAPVRRRRRAAAGASGSARSSQAEQAALEILVRPTSPTALFASQNLVTIGAIRALRQLRKHHEVALVGFDDFLLADLLDPAVTVIAQDPGRMGAVAAQTLFERLEGNVAPTRRHLVPTELVERGSGEIAPPA